MHAVISPLRFTCDPICGLFRDTAVLCCKEYVCCGVQVNCSVRVQTVRSIKLGCQLIAVFPFVLGQDDLSIGKGVLK